jgi:tetratricopeptide (TPR) repeat protein
MTRPCPDERLAALAQMIGENAAGGAIDAALAEHPDDARLYFLKGSVLAGDGDFAAARTALRRAVDLAPDYAIARFQLGFLLLTSGEGHAAQEAWGPLFGLAGDNPLRLFASGLAALARDDFAAAARLLKEGMARGDNAALNRDMGLILEKLGEVAATGASPSSSVDLLLQQAAFKATRH